jgi:hypothetical protein
MRRAMVGRELNRYATLVERDCKRFRRKQMAAGSSRGQQNERRASAHAHAAAL